MQLATALAAFMLAEQLQLQLQLCLEQNKIWKNRQHSTIYVVLLKPAYILGEQ